MAAKSLQQMKAWSDESWWAADGDNCPVDKAYYSWDTSNGMEALMRLHHFVPGRRHTDIICGVMEQDVHDWMNALPYRGVTQPPAAEFRGRGGSSVKFVSTKPDKQDLKPAESVAVGGEIFSELQLLTW